MTKLLNDIKSWIIIWITILLVLFTWIYITKWTWTSTNPWTSDSNIFVNQTGSLTKDKWNVLAKKTLREDFSTSDTNAFNVNCERRWKAQASSTIYWFYWTQVPNDGSSIQNYSHNSYRQVNKWTKWSISTNDWLTRTVIKLERKCQ